MFQRNLLCVSDKSQVCIGSLVNIVNIAGHMSKQRWVVTHIDETFEIGGHTGVSVYCEYVRVFSTAYDVRNVLQLLNVRGFLVVMLVCLFA